MRKQRSEINMSGETVRKQVLFKRFIRSTNLNKNLEFDNHLVSVIKDMNEKYRDKTETFFKTFYFTIEKVENKRIGKSGNKFLKNKYFVSNKYYGFGSVYKIVV